MSGDFGRWASRFWPGGGDSAAAVTAAEARLGVRLPDLLRDYFQSIPLREGQMLHVRPLDALEYIDGLLLFGEDQQSTLSYAVHPSHPEQVLGGIPGSWEICGATLENHLREMVLLNRVYMSPVCLSIDRSVGPPRGWVAWAFPCYELWTDGCAVLDPQQEELGAPDLEALRRAALAVADDPEDLEAAPLSIPRVPADPHAALLRAADARLRGEFERAEAIALELTERNEPDAAVLVALALAGVGRKDWPAVEDALESALRASGDRRLAEALRIWLGGGPVATSGLDLALWPELGGTPPTRPTTSSVDLPPPPPDLESDPARLPDRPVMLARLRVCADHRRRGQLDAAEREVLDVLSEHDDDPLPWVALGLNELARGDRAGAIDACTAAFARTGNRRPAVGLRSLLGGEPPARGLDATLWPELAGRGRVDR